MSKPRCYACGEPLIEVPSGHQGSLSPRHRTRDHVPPKGLFLAPKPSNLICVPCCNQCNGEHSGFDERLRFFAAAEISRNVAGARILKDKILGSTLTRARQRDFVESLIGTMRNVTVRTKQGNEEVTLFTIKSDAIFPGIIRVTKGLLAHLHPDYDYHRDEFDVIDIHSATLLKADRGIQLAIAQEFVRKIAPQARGNHKEFRFWHQIDSNRGAWLLMFYDAVAFVVLHKQAKQHR